MTIPPQLIEEARDKAILDVARMVGAQTDPRRPHHGVPCPGCGGNDRFSVNPDKNIFYCRYSGTGGDAIALVRHVHGVSFAQAVEMLTGKAALPQASPKQASDQSDHFREKARKRAWKAWQSGLPIAPKDGGRLVASYFRQRGIPFPSWRIAALRETPDLAYWQWSKRQGEFVIVHRGPAMLAAITGPATPDYPQGRFMGVHRTWIDLARASGKVEIFDPETGEELAPKKVEGSQRGGRIVLRHANAGGAHVDRDTSPSTAGAAAPAPALAVGEGIETVLSWAHLQDSDAELWAGINLDNIAGKAARQVPHPTRTMTDALGRVRRVKVGGPEPDPADRACLDVPHGAFSRLILLGDADSDRFATTAAMERAAARHAGAAPSVEIDWPPDGQDWNDVLRAASRHSTEGRAA